MSRIKSKDTKIEVKVRQYLFNKGFRYRKNVDALPGRPDIVLKKYRSVIFVNGCYWHRHGNCKLATTPKTNISFWQNKFDRNVENDRKAIKSLGEMGWKVIVIWECNIKKDFEGQMQKLILQLQENEKK